jgi:Ca2+-transporting ATPase
MCTVVRTPAGNVLHCKGAAETILDRCTSFLDEHCEQVPMKPEVMKQSKRLIESWAGNGLRVLCLGFKLIDRDIEVGPNQPLSVHESDSAALTLIGFVGIQDPVRPEVPAAVAQCQRAGITVRMLTGDNIRTAQKYAQLIVMVERLLPF